jgi:DNA-binding MurR/RpiR family transcriptional regulator
MSMASGHTILKLKSCYNSFTKMEKRVADKIIEIPDQVIYFSVNDLAEQSEVGETTVLRFCRKAGFSGFQDFKLALAQDQAREADLRKAEDDSRDGTPFSVMARTQSLHKAMVEDTWKLLDLEELEQAAVSILKADRVMVFGVGSSGLTALQAAHSFTRIGLRSDAKQDSHFQAMEASLLTDNDVAVGFSVSGSTKDTVKNMEIAKKQGASLIAITGNLRSPITTFADIVLLMPVKENPLEGSSILTQMSQFAVLDALVTMISAQTPERSLSTKERVAKAVSEKMY